MSPCQRGARLTAPNAGKVVINIAKAKRANGVFFFFGCKLITFISFYLPGG
jgi:hypothetical protein